MGKLITGTHHIAIRCADVNKFEETVQFYTQILDLEPLRSWGKDEGSGCMLSTGNSILEIFAEGLTVDKTGSVNHFALATQDVDACVKAVRDAGYPITMEPNDIVIGSKIPFPARIAFCIGPNGEEIEFFCEK